MDKPSAANDGDLKITPLIFRTGWTSSTKDKNAFFNAASYAMQAARYLVDDKVSPLEES